MTESTDAESDARGGDAAPLLTADGVITSVGRQLHQLADELDRAAASLWRTHGGY